MKNLLRSFSVTLIAVLLTSACSPTKHEFQVGAVGGGVGAGAGAGIGAAIGSSMANGNVGQSAALGAGIGLPIGVATSLGMMKYAQYEQEKALQSEIDINSEAIRLNQIDIENMRREADDQNRLIEVNPANKRHLYTGPTLGNPFRPGPK